MAESIYPHVNQSLEMIFNSCGTDVVKLGDYRDAMRRTIYPDDPLYVLKQVITIPNWLEQMQEIHDGIEARIRELQP